MVSFHLNPFCVENFLNDDSDDGSSRGDIDSDDVIPWW